MKQKNYILFFLLLILLTGPLFAIPQDDYILGDNATNLQPGEFSRTRSVPATISIYQYATNGSTTTNTRECGWEGKEKVMRKAVTVYSPQGKPRRVIIKYYDRSGAVSCMQVTFINENGRGTQVTQRFFGTYPSGVRKSISTYGSSGFVIKSEFFYDYGELKVLTMTGNMMEAEIIKTETFRYSTTGKNR